MEQNPQILNALLPQQPQTDGDDMSEVTLTGQTIMSQPLAASSHRVEGVTMYHQGTEVSNNQGDSSVADQIKEEVSIEDISREIHDQNISDVDDQKGSELVGTQEVIDESRSSQNANVLADQGIVEVVNSASQVVSKIVGSQDSDVVDQQATDQDINKMVDNQAEVIDQEVINSESVSEAQIKEVVNDQEVTELVTSEGDQTINIQTTSEVIDSDLMVNNSQTSITDQSDVLANSQINQSVPFLPTVDASQDSPSHDVVDTPHHSKSTLEQDDIWQSSFILTQPSCVNCPSELRLLWREPLMNSKVSTQPLLHYTSSLNTDQVT